jgi:hypothetical protein
MTLCHTPEEQQRYDVGVSLEPTVGLYAKRRVINAAILSVTEAVIAESDFFVRD